MPEVCEGEADMSRWLSWIRKWIAAHIGKIEPDRAVNLPAAARARMNHAVPAAEYDPEDSDRWFKDYLERTR